MAGRRAFFNESQIQFHSSPLANHETNVGALVLKGEGRGRRTQQSRPPGSETERLTKSETRTRDPLVGNIIIK